MTIKVGAGRSAPKLVKTCSLPLTGVGCVTRVYSSLAVIDIANGRFMLGRPADVLTSPVLTDLYGAPVFVLRAGDRLVVVGAPDAEDSHHPHHHDDHEAHA